MFLPYIIYPYLTFIGVRKVVKILNNENRKLLYNLVENRIFIESLSDDDIVHFYNCFKIYYRNRFLHIPNIFRKILKNRCNDCKSRE